MSSVAQNTSRVDRYPLGWLVTCVLLGTVVRGLFGWSHSLWNGAPDQSAWDLALLDVATHGLPGYQHLLHYPHEGGSIFLSLLALLLGKLALLPPLSWAALVVEAAVRWIQVHCSFVLFGERTGRWFAVWTILSVPLMLPWATVNFGLHALMSFAPFLLLLALDQGSVLVGLVLGLCAGLAYDVWAMAPAMFLLVVLMGEGAVNVLVRIVGFVGAAALGFLPHVVLRATVDHGFALEQWSTLSIRGIEETSLTFGDLPQRFFRTMFEVLPASLTLGPISNGGVRAISVVVLGALVYGGYRTVRSGRPAGRWLPVMLLSFIVALVFLPLYDVRGEGHGLIYYRYFPFVVPALGLWVIHGFCESGGRWKLLCVGWVLFCGSLSVGYMVRAKRIETPNDEATGWVLARKYGDHPTTLIRLAGLLAPAKRAGFYRGCGWGTAAALFEGRNAADSASVIYAQELFSAYPPEYKAMVEQGCLRAFEAGITPGLDPRLRVLLEARGMRR